MPSCECCYKDIGLDRDDSYSLALARHQDRGCVCTMPTFDGLRARAGQFWQNGKDRRYTDEEWSGILAKLEASRA